MGIAGTGRGDDHGGDEGGLFGWGPVIRHIWTWWQIVKMWLSEEGLSISLPISRRLHLFRRVHAATKCAVGLDAKACKYIPTSTLWRKLGLRYCNQRRYE